MYVIEADLMDSRTVLKKLKLIENIKLKIPDGTEDIFKNLRLLTENDSAHLENSLKNPEYKYIGQVGKDFFNIKHNNNSFRQILDISAIGKTTRVKGTDWLEIEINGFHKKWFFRGLIMLPLFAIFLLFLDNSLGTRIFLCVVFVYIPFGQIMIMKFFKNRFKKNLKRELKKDIH